jgi:hypothetical protein
MTKSEKSGRVEFRKALAIWVAGALLGWGVAVAGVYGAGRAGVMIAGLLGGQHARPEPLLQSEPLQPETAGRLQDIAPAAGDPARQ